MRIKKNEIKKYLRYGSLGFSTFGLLNILIMLIRRFPHGSYWIALWQDDSLVEAFARRAYISFFIAFVLLVINEFIKEDK